MATRTVTGGQVNLSQPKMIINRRGNVSRQIPLPQQTARGSTLGPIPSNVGFSQPQINMAPPSQMAPGPMVPPQTSATLAPFLQGATSAPDTGASMQAPFPMPVPNVQAPGPQVSLQNPYAQSPINTLPFQTNMNPQGMGNTIGETMNLAQNANQMPPYTNAQLAPGGIGRNTRAGIEQRRMARFQRRGANNNGY